MNFDLNREFNLQKDLIYLNHAAVSPWPVRTAERVKSFAEENTRHGSLYYPQWIKVESALRDQAKLLINAPSKNDIALVKNTSEALSLVAYGIDWSSGDNIVSSNEEFPSNRIVWESLSDKGVEFREAELTIETSPEDSIFSLVDDRTRLVTISSVQFSTGLRMNLERIGELCKKRNILFCVDAIQSIGAVECDVQKIQADFVMADGHKWMLGPEGLAIFYSSPQARDSLRLNQYGWHMVELMGDYDRRDWSVARTARRFECGSPNMLGIHALDASLSLIMDIGMTTIEKEVISRSSYLLNKLQEMPEIELITPNKEGRYAGIVSFRHKRADNTALFESLMDNNIFCAFRNGGIRFSHHFYTPMSQLQSTIKLLRALLN